MKRIDRKKGLDRELLKAGYSLMGIMRELDIPLEHYEAIVYNIRHARKWRQSKHWEEVARILEFIGVPPVEFFTTSGELH